MDKVIGEYLTGITPGEPQVYRNFGVVPLFHPSNGGPAYLTLKEAMGQGVLTIGELGAEGTVPELKVMNKGDTAVLLLDGEEVRGVIEYYDRDMIKINRTDGPNVFIRKQHIRYMFKDPIG